MESKIQCRFHGAVTWDGRSWRCTNEKCRSVVQMGKTVEHPVCPGQGCGVALVSRECPACVEIALKLSGR